MAKKNNDSAYDPGALLLGKTSKPKEAGQRTEDEPKKKPQNKGAKNAQEQGKKVPASQKKKQTDKKADKKTKGRTEKEQGKTQYKGGSSYRQKRDKRLQIVLTEDLYKRLQEEKETSGASVNEIVNVLLEKGLR